MESPLPEEADLFSQCHKPWIFLQDLSQRTMLLCATGSCWLSLVHLPTRLKKEEECLDLALVP